MVHFAHMLLSEEMIKSGSLLLLQRRVSFEPNVTVTGYDSNIEDVTIFFLVSFKPDVTISRYDSIGQFGMGIS